MLRGSIFGILAVGAAFLSWFLFGRASHLDSIPLRSATQISDLADGTEVMAYGTLEAAVSGMVAYNIEHWECENHYRNGRNRRECDWKVRSRRYQPFKIGVNSNGVITSVAVVNSNYTIDSPLHTVDDSSDNRRRGFQQGDQILAIGKIGQNGIIATTIYGGTRSSYIGMAQIIAWVAAVGAAVLLLIAVACVWRS